MVRPGANTKRRSTTIRNMRTNNLNDWCLYLAGVFLLILALLVTFSPQHVEGRPALSLDPDSSSADDGSAEFDSFFDSQKDSSLNQGEQNSKKMIVRVIVTTSSSSDFQEDTNNEGNDDKRTKEDVTLQDFEFPISNSKSQQSTESYKKAQNEIPEEREEVEDIFSAFYKAFAQNHQVVGDASQNVERFQLFYPPIQRQPSPTWTENKDFVNNNRHQDEKKELKVVAVSSSVRSITGNGESHKTFQPIASTSTTTTPLVKTAERTNSWRPFSHSTRREIDGPQSFSYSFRTFPKLTAPSTTTTTTEVSTTTTSKGRIIRRRQRQRARTTNQRRRGIQEEEYEQHGPIVVKVSSSSSSVTKTEPIFPMPQPQALVQYQQETTTTQKPLSQQWQQWHQPEQIWGEPEKVWSEPAKVWGEPAKIWGSPEINWGTSSTTTTTTQPSTTTSKNPTTRRARFITKTPKPTIVPNNFQKHYYNQRHQIRQRLPIPAPSFAPARDEDYPRDAEASETESTDEGGTFVILGEDETEQDSIDGAFDHQLGIPSPREVSPRPISLNQFRNFNFSYHNTIKNLNLSSLANRNISSFSLRPDDNFTMSSILSSTSSSSSSNSNNPANVNIESSVNVGNSSETDDDRRGPFGYVLEGNDVRRYRVEEKTPDGFIVGEYGVLNNQNAFLRGVRYTADGTINPRLIHEALMKFLALRRR